MSELDVFVIQEETFVEAADLTDELGSQEHRSSGEHGEVGRFGTDRNDRIASPAIRSGSEAVQFHPCTVDGLPVGSDQQRLDRADVSVGELIEERLQPTRLHLHIVVEYHDGIDALGYSRGDAGVRCGSKPSVRGGRDDDPGLAAFDVLDQATPSAATVVDDMDRDLG